MLRGRSVLGGAAVRSPCSPFTEDRQRVSVPPADRNQLETRKFILSRRFISARAPPFSFVLRHPFLFRSTPFFSCFFLFFFRKGGDDRGRGHHARHRSHLSHVLRLPGHGQGGRSHHAHVANCGQGQPRLVVAATGDVTCARGRTDLPLPPTAWMHVMVAAEFPLLFRCEPSRRFAPARSCRVRGTKNMAGGGGANFGKGVDYVVLACVAVLPVQRVQRLRGGATCAFDNVLPRDASVVLVCHAYSYASRFFFSPCLVLHGADEEAARSARRGQGRRRR